MPERGVGIGDLLDRVEERTAGEESQAIVFICAGENDIGRIGSEELFVSFREIVGRVRYMEAIPVICGISCGILSYVDEIAPYITVL